MPEPGTADILQAIAKLKTHFDGRLDALRVELKTEIGDLRTEIAEFKADVRGDFKAVNARLDEQRQTINALIPTRIAAVPPAAE